MWLDKEDISWYAKNYCEDVKNDPKIRKHITDPYCAYMYCRYVRDDPEVRKYINNHIFLRHLKNRREKKCG